MSSVLFRSLHARFDASGALDLPGAMFTASHNPAQYNGIKLCRAGASPVGQDSGLATLLGPVEHGGGGQDWTTALRKLGKGTGRNAAAWGTDSPTYFKRANDEKAAQEASAR